MLNLNLQKFGKISKWKSQIEIYKISWESQNFDFLKISKSRYPQIEKKNFVDNFLTKSKFSLFLENLIIFLKLSKFSIIS